MERVTLGADLFKERLTGELSWLRIDPTYNPAEWFSNGPAVRNVRFVNYTGAFHLHDNGAHPHNRQGLDLQLRWQFDEGRGRLSTRCSWLSQTDTSLYDVRVPVDGLAVGLPNFPVIGYSPGFVDGVFAGFAHPNLYGPGTANSFTDRLEPLENPRGYETSWEVRFSERFPDPGLDLNVAYRHLDFLRRSSLPAHLGGSQNHVDMDVDYFSLETRYDLGPRWRLLQGLEYVYTGGHLDPGGRYQAYALQTGSTDFTNLDSVQWIPMLGLELDLTQSSQWNLQVRHYLTNDRVAPEVGAGLIPGSFGSSAHPFRWDGWQVQSQFRLDF